ncbi:MAG TPA: hypothetical protein VIN03_01535, partial [Roseateles sp.]
DLMTDQEALVQNILERPGAGRPAIRIVSTQGMSAWQVLREFSNYREIDTNGSSLAFWAAVLCGAHFSSSNPQHVDAWRVLTH